FLVLELFDVLVELIQSSFPQPTARRQPIFNDLEPFWRNLVRPYTSALLRLHQPALLEHRQVLHERRQLHVERCCQLADGGWPDGQLLQNFPPGRIGQGVKNIVSDRGLNHFNTSRLVGWRYMTERLYPGIIIRSIPKYISLIQICWRS